MQASSSAEGTIPPAGTIDEIDPTTGLTVTEAREVVESYIRDFAQELHDAAPIRSSVSRAFRLYQASGWTLEGFITALYEARSITKERSASIGANDKGETLPAKRKMAYFFACLEDKLGLRKP